MSCLAQQRDDDIARRVSIQASIARKTDELVRWLDPALRNCSHAEHVRRLVVLLGEIGALDDPWSSAALQEALTELAADVQAWLEQNLRDAAR